MKRDYFQLDEQAELFELLSKKPKWWKELIGDNDLYCNIRKGNRINVYYRGASIMDLFCKNGKIEAKIHNYYLGYEKNLCEEYKVKYGYISLNPEDIICRIPTIKKRVEINKKNKADIDFGEEREENISEKYIQSQMYLENKLYIDTEFALTLDDGTNIRIDLVRLSEDGAVCFEELKLIDDSRLKPKGKKQAEIITQMNNYDKFLKEASKIKGSNSEPIIIEYYSKVLRIMKKIGILRTEFEPKYVRDHINLFIKLTYTKKHPKRNHAMTTIQNVCKGLHSNIEDVVKEYENLRK